MRGARRWFTLGILALGTATFLYLLWSFGPALVWERLREFGWGFAAYGYDGRGNADCVLTTNDVAVANYFIANYSASPNRPFSGPADFAAQAAHLPHAHGPEDFQELVVPGAHQVYHTLGPPLDGEFIQFDGAGVGLAVLAIPAEAALQGQQQGNIDDDAVEAADDGFGHVFRQGDARSGEVDALFAGSVPVYWGAPDIEKYMPGIMKTIDSGLNQKEDTDTHKRLVPALIRKGIDSINLSMFNEDTKKKLLNAAGTELFKKGRFQEAVKAFSATSNKEKLIEVGDYYVNINMYDPAIDTYKVADAKEK